MVYRSKKVTTDSIGDVEEVCLWKSDKFSFKQAMKFSYISDNFANMNTGILIKRKTVQSRLIKVMYG